MRILDTVKNAEEREWYIRQTVQNGWSRNVLVHQIESSLFQRQGKALTNFSQTLPEHQPELAQQLIKDPYNFDFLTIGSELAECDLERGLIEHLRNLILELGKGFAFMGSQYHLEVGEQDFYLDLLFYHVRLHCYVVIDLKIEDFKPEFAGKMNFYLSAVDEQKRRSTMDDESSLSHTKWECKYHVVIIPKCRRKTLYQGLRRHFGEVFRSLAEQREGKIEEGHLQVDHVHMMISIPPKYAVSQVIWIYQRQECHTLGEGMRGAKTQFCGAALLGTRILGVYGRLRRGRDLGVYTKARERQTIRPIKTV